MPEFLVSWWDTARSTVSSWLDTLRERGFNDISLIIIGALIVLVILFIFFAAVVLPRRKRKGLKKADKLLRKNQKEQFGKAVELLLAALKKGLRRGDADYAAYLLAYAYTRMADYEKAYLRLEEMKAEDSDNPDVLYLLLYTQVHLEKYDEASRLYQIRKSKLRNFEEAGKLYAFACLHIAVKHWNSNETAEAIDFFVKVKEIGEYQQYIPAGISNQQTLLGLRALQDGNIAKAREAFQNAVAGELSGKGGVEAKIGLALCTWVEEETPDIDAALSEILSELKKSGQADKNGKRMLVRCSGCSEVFSTPETEEKMYLSCRSCGVRFQAEPCKNATGEEKTKAKRLLQEPELLLLNVLLLYSQSFLFKMVRSGKGSGLTDAQRQEYRRRIGDVLEIDPDELLAQIAISLFEYFAGDTQEDKDKAIEALEKLEGVEHSEIQNLIQEKLIRNKRSKNVMKEYLELLEKYMTDTDIPLQYRQALLNKLNQNSVFIRWNESREVSVEQTQTEPSISLLQKRGLLMKERVEKFMQAKHADTNYDEAEITESLKNIEEITAQIKQKIAAMEDDEHKVMDLSSELLLQEDNVQPGAEDDLDHKFTAEVSIGKPEDLA